MNICKIKTCDVANGVGIRTSVFVSGCRRACPGCFNTLAWDFNYGDRFTSDMADAIVESLVPPYIQGLTVLGGEPMEPENQRGLVGFLERVRTELPDKDIWCYTGDMLDDLLEGGVHHTEVTDRLLACIDVLVDGPFIEAEKSPCLRFRGSKNQRILDMPATLAKGAPVLWDGGVLRSSSFS